MTAGGSNTSDAMATPTMEIGSPAAIASRPTVGKTSELLHDTIDSRSDLRGPHGLHPAGQHYDIRCVRRSYRYDRDLGRGCVRWRRRLTARGAAEQSIGGTPCPKAEEFLYESCAGKAGR